jgi:hypothetical protein
MVLLAAGVRRAREADSVLGHMEADRVLEHMPTKHVVAMLNAAPAAQGAETLMAMPAERIEVLLNEMTPAQVGRLLDGARADRKPDLLAVIGPDRAATVLTQFSVHQLANVVASLRLPDALDLLGSVAPEKAADVLQEMSGDHRIMLQEALMPREAHELASAVYHREVMESVVRIATRTWWLDQAAGHLLAEVMGRPFQIVARHMPDAMFNGSDLRTVASEVDWRRVVGAMVLTNATPADGVVPVIRELRQYGHAVDVVRRINDGDDGQVKRALVRLAA